MLADIRSRLVCVPVCFAESKYTELQFNYFFVKVRNLVSHTEGRTRTEDTDKQGAAEENI
jgi:hypothetical protein